MSQMQKDEIDLVELFQTIWDGKWVITAISVISMVGMLLVNFFLPAPNFVATTEIRPILPNQAVIYQAFNNTGIFEIYAEEAKLDRNRDNDGKREGDRERDSDRDRDRDPVPRLVPLAGLHERYIDILARRQAFQEGFKKFAVLEREKYDSDADYDIAVARLAASIEILPPTDKSRNDRGDDRIHWTIKFEYNDQKKWLSVLDYTARSVDEAVRTAIAAQFEKLLNANKLKKAHEIEDLKFARENLIAIYKEETKNRIAFLEEQAAIAKELGIAKNGARETNLVARTFDSVTNAVTGKRDVISEVQSDLPFYLRGYIAIEKELSILNSRESVEPFVENLVDIDHKIHLLANNKQLERAEQLFALTPAATGKGFIASSVSVEGTQFEPKSNKTLMLSLTFVLSMIVGVFYVLIASKFSQRGYNQTGAKSRHL